MKGEIITGGNRTGIYTLSNRGIQFILFTVHMYTFNYMCEIHIRVCVDVRFTYEHMSFTYEYYDGSLRQTVVIC